MYNNNKVKQTCMIDYNVILRNNNTITILPN